MINTISSLIKLRSKLIVKTPNTLVLLLMPLGFSLLYNEMLNNGENSSQILFISLAFTFGFSIGTLITSTIGEEKEKNSLRSLRLIGVKSMEYILATVFYPIVITLLAIIFYPILVDGCALTDMSSNYFIISTLTGLACILFYFLIAWLSSTQSQGQINSILAMVLITLVPMFAQMNETFQSINKYSFMDALTQLLSDQNQVEITDQPFIILSLWIIVLFVANILFYRRKA
ncbi:MULTISPECIES: ABC transporter permease [Aerococcus]|uniref:ABC transporter permease n=2 Tax=Aerococcaceae TaxID=186827 RepID=A0A5N1GNR7_9LACT|nr:MULTISPECIES: ABC transporter permease [Aerococcus]KAA9302432.1 ABC transporter permease [Aerococcus sanguinicola]MDK6369806.1 ABC transporter permease [Aerococcus sp. UMB9870]MDK6680446.1 ABC transporter permease [Aerococcus sp. UMB8608]MDK6687057.1 ABC transporter permease [Aerococcus sp. UMB8623]MDK6940276.1 ABC transporter permease [Aerococcus sp. UMB8487]